MALMKLHYKYERSGPFSFRNKDFLKVLPMEKNYFSAEKVEVNSRLSFFFFFFFIGPMSPTPHSKSQIHWPFGSGEEDFYFFFFFLSFFFLP